MLPVQRIVHLALCASPLFAGVAFYFLRSANPMAASAEPSLTEIFRMVGAVSALGGAAAALFLPRLLAKAAEQDFQIRLLSWALAEGASLMNLVFFYLTGNSEHIVAAAVSWIFLIFSGPKTKG